MRRQSPQVERHVITLKKKLAPLHAQLQNHPMYKQLQNMEDIRCFMENHVVAVWDFMCLLKHLQRELTCVSVPWTPKGDPICRRLINDIVLAEESDLIDGQYASHFEFYLAAMENMGANTQPIRDFITGLEKGTHFSMALASSNFPESAKQFLRCTWSVLESNDLPSVAAAFTLGREDVIPQFFQVLVKSLQSQFPNQFTLLVRYLQRHIDLDGDEHGPMALQLLSTLCQEDSEKWTRVEASASAALEARIQLWDGLSSQLNRTK